jgi:integrase
MKWEAKHVTDRWIANLERPPPGEQNVWLYNLERGLSLVLVQSYGGTKTFRALTYRKGKPKSVKLGTYPPQGRMKLAEAMEKARQHFADPDPTATRAKVATFKDVAEEWFAEHVEGRLITEREVRRQLERYVYPEWADRKFLDIKRSDVNDLLDRMARRNRRPQADAVLATLRNLMHWHEIRDEDYVMPIIRGMKRDKRGAKERRRSRILDDHELRLVWATADEVEPTFGAMLKLLLLTGQRRMKVAAMHWSDIKDGVWIIRTAKREKGTGEKLKLPKVALDIIEAQPRIAGNPHVFAAARGRGAFNSFGQRKSEIDSKLGEMPQWRLHDLRRTARSLMSRAGVKREVAELTIGHEMGGVEVIYDRHSYIEEKADALNRLAALIEQIVDSPEGNVVPLRA